MLQYKRIPDVPHFIRYRFFLGGQKIKKNAGPVDKKIKILSGFVTFNFN